jgi:hypothetical protein
MLGSVGYVPRANRERMGLLVDPQHIIDNGKLALRQIFFFHHCTSNTIYHWKTERMDLSA